MFTFAQSLGYIMPGSVSHEHVDDLNQSLVSRSKAKLNSKSIELGIAVKKAIHELDFKLADKHSSLSMTMGWGNALRTTLQSKGVTMKIAKIAADPGIETAAGTQRCAATQNRRTDRGSTMAQGNRTLSKINAKAHCLGPTGTHNQQSYGHTAQGASGHQAHNMKTNLENGTCLNNPKSCPTTTLAWFLGSANDPDLSGSNK